MLNENSCSDVVNSEVLDYINNYYSSSDDLEEFRISCENQHIPIIKRETQGFLELILNLYCPKNILEIGTGAGYSSVFFGKLLPDCKITTIELIEKRYVEANINMEKYGLQSQMEIIEGDASIVLDGLIETGDKNFDFVFIDSAKSRYREFFQKSLSMMPDGGLIICDNVLLDGRTASDSFMTKHRERTSMTRMREFVEFVKSYEGADTKLLNIGDGMTVSLIKTEGEML